MTMDLLSQNDDEVNRNLGWREYSDGYNYCRIIRQSESLNVVARYSPSGVTNGFCTLDENLNTVTFTEDVHGGIYFVYGVFPLILDAMSNVIRTKDDVDQFIKNNPKFFMFHKVQEKYVLPMARYFTVALANTRGLLLKLPDSLAKNYLGQPGMHMYLKKHLGYYFLSSLVPDAMLKKYNELFSIDGRAFRPHSDGQKLIDLIHDDSLCMWLYAYEFTQEVVMRPVGLNQSGNTITVLYERSSQITDMLLERGYVDYPCLENADKTIIKQFFHNIRESIQKLSGDFKSPSHRDSINPVILFLNTSYGVNHVMVGGRAISSDGLILHNRIQDEGTPAYPIVMGSVTIQRPQQDSFTTESETSTINIQDNNADLSTEIVRLARAQLMPDLKDEDWKADSMVIFGTLSRQEDSSSQGPARLHIGFVYSLNCSDAFEDLYQMEVREGEVRGVRLHHSSSKLAVAWRYVLRGLHWVVNSKDVIESLIIIIMAIQVQDITLSNIAEHIVSIFMAGVIIIASFIDFIWLVKKKIRRENRIKRFWFID